MLPIASRPSSSSSMDRCPTEIHLKIFRFACTDGGRTGCALSLVSRRIHAASFPVRFHTVVLRGVPRMRRFLAFLNTRTSLPIVSHLFLYDDGEEGQLYLEENPLGTVASIILTVAPSLLTLAGSIRYIALESGYASIVPRGVHLPLLRDLSLAVGGWRHELVNTRADLCPLPSLRRVHIWGRVSRGDLLDLDAVTTVAPQLAQIRLSNANQFVELPRILEAGLDQDVPSSRSSARRKDIAVYFPAGLQRLIVQCAIVTSRQGRVLHDAMQARLAKLAGKHEKLTLAASGNYTIEDCRKDWLDAIEMMMYVEEL